MNSTKKKKILLIRVPEICYKEQSADVRNTSIPGLSVPMGVTYIAAVIQRDGRYDVDILDLYAENYLDYISGRKTPKDILTLSHQRIEDYIQQNDPAIVGFSALFLFQHSLTKELIVNTKNKFPHVRTYLGGYPTVAPEIVMKDIPELDVLFIGEGEKTLVEVLDIEVNGGTLSAINGLAFRENGELKVNKALNLVDDINTIPFPAYDLLPLEIYQKVNGKNEFPFMSSRSCPFFCGFCAVSVYSERGLRIRSLENLMQEIKILHEKYKVDLLMIRDDNFIVHKKHVKGFLKELIATDQVVPWLDSSGLYVNSIDEELLDLCKATGTNEIIFPVESGSPRVLKEIMKKNVNLEHAKKMAAYCRKIGLAVQCYFVIGNPGETKEEIMQTIEFAKEMQVDHCTFSLATPLPGTAYYETAVKNNYLIHDAEYILSMKYMEAQMETENFTTEWLKDTQYDANIKVNFLANKNLYISKKTKEDSLKYFARVYRQYNFHAIAHLIVGYLEGELGNFDRQTVVFHEVTNMLKDEKISKAYAKYIEWDTPPTNCYRKWLELYLDYSKLKDEGCPLIDQA